MDAALIPEVPFQLEGEHGLLAYLDSIMEKKGHCVVCVAEGAGQARSCVLLRVPASLRGRLRRLLHPACLPFWPPV